VFLSTTKVPLSRLRHLVEECERIGIAVKRMRIDLYRIADRELGWVLPTTETEEIHNMDAPITPSLISTDAPIFDPGAPKRLTTEH